MKKSFLIVLVYFNSFFGMNKENKKLIPIQLHPNVIHELENNYSLSIENIDKLDPGNFTNVTSFKIKNNETILKTISEEYQKLLKRNQSLKHQIRRHKNNIIKVPNKKRKNKLLKCIPKNIPTEIRQKILWYSEHLEKDFEYYDYFFLTNKKNCLPLIKITKQVKQTIYKALLLPYLFTNKHPIPNKDHFYSLITTRHPGAQSKEIYLFYNHPLGILDFFCSAPTHTWGADRFIPNGDEKKDYENRFHSKIKINNFYFIEANYMPAGLARAFIYGITINKINNEITKPFKLPFYFITYFLQFSGNYDTKILRWLWSKLTGDVFYPYYISKIEYKFDKSRTKIILNKNLRNIIDQVYEQARITNKDLPNINKLSIKEIDYFLDNLIHTLKNKYSAQKESYIITVILTYYFKLIRRRFFPFDQYLKHVHVFDSKSVSKSFFIREYCKSWIKTFSDFRYWYIF